MGSKSAGPGGQMGGMGDVQPFDMPPTQQGGQPMNYSPMQPPVDFNQPEMMYAMGAPDGMPFPDPLPPRPPRPMPGQAMATGSIDPRMIRGGLKPEWPFPNRTPIDGGGQPALQPQQMNPAIQNALRLALSRLGIR